MYLFVWVVKECIENSIITPARSHSYITSCIRNIFIKMVSGRSDEFINVKRLRSLLWLQRERGSDASPPACLTPAAQSHRNLVPRKTRRHPSGRRKLTRTLTPWRLHLEDTSAPPARLSRRVRSASRSLSSHTHTHARTLTHEITHRTHCAQWLTGAADCSTSQTPFQTRDN